MMPDSAQPDMRSTLFSFHNQSLYGDAPLMRKAIVPITCSSLSEDAQLCKLLFKIFMIMLLIFFSKAVHTGHNNVSSFKNNARQHLIYILRVISRNCNYV